MTRWTRGDANRFFGRVMLVALGCLGALIAIALYAFVRPALTSARDVRIGDPAVAVREARALIVERNLHPERFGPYTEVRDLPRSLQIDGLRYAKVHADHVDLVLWRNPDVALGARVWADEHRDHRDAPTRYPQVFFFRYTHEQPESPANVP